MTKTLPKILIFLFASFICTFAQAAYRSYTGTPTFTYDLGVSTGSYNNESYSEIQLGLNWYVKDYLNWRNAIFTRFGSNSESAAGLDSSARFFWNSSSDPNELGLGVYAGPGLRISKTENTGVFGEAGLMLKGAGVGIGGGVKSIYYPNPGTDSQNRDRAHSDTVVTLVIGMGGAL